MTLERIAKLDRAAMARSTSERFANAADFTFFMVGAFKIDEVVPLVARYVVRCRRRARRRAASRTSGSHSRRRSSARAVEKGASPVRRRSLSFFADPPLEENEQTRVEAATDVLEIALRDILREELGETYSVRSGLAQQMPQRGGGHIAVSFGAAPENIERMIERDAAGGPAAAEGRAVRGSGRPGPRRRRAASTRPR